MTKPLIIRATVKTNILIDHQQAVSLKTTEDIIIIVAITEIISITTMIKEEEVMITTVVMDIKINTIIVTVINRIALSLDITNIIKEMRKMDKKNINLESRM